MINKGCGYNLSASFGFIRSNGITIFRSPKNRYVYDKIKMSLYNNFNVKQVKLVMFY
jgi:hypothetical protein